MEDKKERKLLYRKFFILAIALLCAFASLGAYSWAWVDNKFEDYEITETYSINELTTDYLIESGKYYIIKTTFQNESFELTWEIKNEIESFNNSISILMNNGVVSVDDTNYIVDWQKVSDNWEFIFYINADEPGPFIILDESDGLTDTETISEIKINTIETTFTSSIFETLAAIITSFTVLLGSLFASVANIFYSNNQLTIIGILTLIGMATGLVMWGLSYIKKLIRIRTKK